MQENREPLISVIIPAYQVEEYIERCMDSVCGQEYENIEILLVYKESQDRTAEMCRELALQDSRVIAMECEQEGVSASRNMALEVSKGEYIAFIDADDYVEKEYLSRLYQYIRKADISICGFDRVKPDYTQKESADKDIIYEKDTLLVEILSNNTIGGYLWNKLFRGKVIREKQLRFKTNLSIGEDMCFIVSYIKEIQMGRYCNRILYHYCINKQSALQKMYTTGIFEEKKLSNMQAAEYIAEQLADSSPQVQEAVSYRVVRTSMWTLFNLLKCNHYDKQLLNDIRGRMKGRCWDYCRNKYTRKIEQISCLLFYLCPGLFWKVAMALLQILPSSVVKKYVNS